MFAAVIPPACMPGGCVEIKHPHGDASMNFHAYDLPYNEMVLAVVIFRMVHKTKTLGMINTSPATKMTHARTESLTLKYSSIVLAATSASSTRFR